MGPAPFQGRSCAHVAQLRIDRLGDYASAAAVAAMKSHPAASSSTLPHSPPLPIAREGISCVRVRPHRCTVRTASSHQQVCTSGLRGRPIQRSSSSSSRHAIPSRLSHQVQFLSLCQHRHMLGIPF
ncbi:hypothetical protein TcWFU_001281 [Taenia crassiceps]|uniref:Uncharacterized protein n=1 Tax=Taenia crassiceps TaxID=6207 RepID=A0ABR4QCT7_9CEST